MRVSTDCSCGCVPRTNGNRWQAAMTWAQPLSRALRMAPFLKLRVPGLQSVRRAQGTLNANKGKLEADFAPEHRQEGQQAIAALDAALKDFAATVDANDKQVEPFPGSMGTELKLALAAFAHDAVV
jgi:hypothetical protein